MKFTVNNRWSGKVQFTADIECDEYFEDASKPIEDLRDRVISELELKLMALKEEE